LEYKKDSIKLTNLVNVQQGYMMSRFKFLLGPWNVHEGADAFGPEVRKPISLEDKIEKFSEMGIDAVMFHDDNTVPMMNNLSNEGIIKEAKEVKTLLNSYNLAAEFVAPRLWIDPHTIDGGFTSTRKEDREFAIWRSLRSVDIARALGCNNIVLWLAREGTLCAESKDPMLAINRILEGINPILSYRTIDPKRVGG